MTYYCSKNAGSLGTVDNRLEKGDVAIHPSHGMLPKRVNAKQVEFYYINFMGKIFRVADSCPDRRFTVDIYQGIKEKCDCSKQSPYPPVSQQAGSPLSIYKKAIENVPISK